jgi:hypothetical protein
MTSENRSGSLVRSGPIARYRRRVPQDLVDAIGLTEIKKSLRTRDPAAARIAWRQLDLEVEQRFAALRARLPIDLPAKLRRNAPKDTLSADDRAYILARLEHRLLDRDDAFREVTDADDGDQWDLYRDLTADALEAAAQFTKGIHPKLRVALQKDLEEAGLTPDPLSADYLSLAKDYNRTAAETLRMREAK